MKYVWGLVQGLLVLLAIGFIVSLFEETPEEKQAKIAQETAENAAKEREYERSAKRATTILFCHRAVLSQVKFPTRAVFDSGQLQAASVTPVGASTEDRVVRGRVELLNGLGALIPHTYGCEIKNGEVSTVAINPG